MQLRISRAEIEEIIRKHFDNRSTYVSPEVDFHLIIDPHDLNSEAEPDFYLEIEIHDIA